MKKMYIKPETAVEQIGGSMAILIGSGGFGGGNINNTPGSGWTGE